LLLSDARLDDADRGTISARIQFNRVRWVPLGLPAPKKPAGVVGGTNAEWAQYVESVSEDFRSLEREIDQQRLTHNETLRYALKRELRSLKEAVEAAQAALSDAEKALARQREIDDYVACRIEAFVDAHTREEQTAYNAAVGTLEEARRDAQRRHEAQQRAWWAAVATHPIASVVDRLPSVPAEYIAPVIGRLVALAATDPYVHHEDVHRFLLAHRRSAGDHDASAPVVVASAGHLVAMGDDGAARALLDSCSAAGRSPLSGVVDYLRYVLRKEPDLFGAKAYRTLTVDDLFLGARYYEEDDPYEGNATATLQQQSQWDYPSLERALRTATNDGNTKYLNDFKARGLQPRIAELAFREVVDRLRGADAAQRLSDLNAEYVARVAHPRTLASQPKDLPKVDWADKEGRRYDVKCNIFLRSKQEKVGLRGFLIKLKRTSDRHCSYPAFVFWHTTDEYCQWVYVGEYRPAAASNYSAEARVLPFDCRLPDELRFVLPRTNSDLDAGIPLLRDRFLNLGWRLAAGLRAAPRHETSMTAESFLDDIVDRCVEEDAGVCLERAIWMALTDATFDACSRCDHALVGTFLELAEKLIANRALPIRLPRIEGKPILSRWIDYVLKPLVEHWSQIRCPACGANSFRSGTIQLSVTRMTSEGTIYGRMTCGQCGLADAVTLLTHCYECSHYPLIIGKNRLCAHCKGLVCEWPRKGWVCERPAPDTKPVCGCCKKDCPQRQIRAGTSANVI